MRPPSTHHARGVGVVVDRSEELGQGRSLAPLHLLDDGQPEPVLRSEVMAEHPVAGAELLGEGTQAEVTESALGRAIDRGIEKATTRSGVLVGR